jgi:tripartite-type tricarboxylate transporter receptor subunit TctC
VAYPHIKSGTLRALANTSANRSPQLPEVPTIAEAGFPEVTVLSWYGLHAPTGTPPEVVRKLEAGVQASLLKSETKERLNTAGGEAAFLSTPDFSQFMRTDLQMWERINRMLKK